jgi:hypothetical protein
MDTAMSSRSMKVRNTQLIGEENLPEKKSFIKTKEEKVGSKKIK